MGIFDKLFAESPAPQSERETEKQKERDGGAQLGDALAKLISMKPEDMKKATKEMRSLRRKIEADRAERKTPLAATGEERGKYRIIKTENYLNSFEGTVNPGELLVVRMLDNSKVLVMTGGGLRVMDSVDTEITRERGAEVKIEKMDSSVSIIDKEPKLRNCPNCGAPLTGASCSYCGTLA